MYPIKAVLFVVSCMMSVTIYSQDAPNSLVKFEEQALIAGVNNHFKVVAQQSHPVTLSQLSATLYYNNGQKASLHIEEQRGKFTIKPDSLGKVEIQVTLGDTIETTKFRVYPMTAVGKLSFFKANHEGTIGPGEFKAQRGLNAVVECCGFDAKCEIFSYEVYRITKDNIVEINLNKGGAFDEKTRLIIDRTQPGDVFLFRKIMYMCPGSTKPQRLEDMTFEIK